MFTVTTSLKQVLSNSDIDALGNPKVTCGVYKPLENFESNNLYVNCRFEKLTGTGHLSLAKTYVKELIVDGNLSCHKAVIGKAQVTGNFTAHNCVFEDILITGGEIQAIETVFQNAIKMSPMQNLFQDCYTKDIQYNIRGNPEKDLLPELRLENTLIRGDVKYFKQKSEKIQIQKKENSAILGKIIDTSDAG